MGVEGGPGDVGTTHSFRPTTAGRLGNGVCLTPLSPLTDRSKLCASPALDNVALGLSNYGFQVAWDSGYLQVSPAHATTRPRDAPVTLSLDSFMGGQTRKRDTYGYRHKVTSSVTFTKGATKPLIGTGATMTSPSSATAASFPAQLATDTQARCSTPAPSAAPSAPLAPPGVRFSRQAQSVDSLQQLNVQLGGNINTHNLVTLSQPGWAGAPSARPGTAPASGRPTRLQPTHITDQRPQTASPRDATLGHHPQSTTQGHMPVGSFSASVADAAAPGAFTPARPSTAFVDLNKEAGAALRPTTSGSRLERPHTTRPGSRANAAGRGFRPTRGHALVVFQHMDKDKNGKVTLSELEDAALAVGFSLDQAHKLFKRMDKSGKGYLQASDWGNLEMGQVVELFSLGYMQRFMGLPGPTARPEQVSKYWALQELKAVRSVAAAIHMARSNAILRGAHASNGSGNVIFEAFRFIDTDGSGKLSYEELRDGFYALGVYVKDEVMRQMMTNFDTDNDGSVNYFEFVHRLFPTHSRGMR